MHNNQFNRSISKTVRISFVVLGIFSMTGCGSTLLSPRSENPVIQDYNSSFLGTSHSSVYATTASRRLAIMNTKGEVCAEPSPDVGEAISSSIANELKAALSIKHPSGSEGSGELQDNYRRAIATQIAPLLYRTQGLQYYRDSLYTLCIAKMNGTITQNEYVIKLKEYSDTASQLIGSELPRMEEIAKTYYQNVKVGNTSQAQPAPSADDNE